jgi:succinoglycan biosynthesis protein ExoA
MKPEPAPAVLVVIPCLNEAAHLAGLLQALDGPLTDPGLFIVVADGGSHDGSREIVEAWMKRSTRVVLLHNPDRLQSAGVNLAVAVHGEGRRYLVRVDAHARYPEDFVGALVRTAETRGADSVVVPLRSVGLDCFQVAAAAAQNSVIGAGGAAHRQGGVAGWIDHGHHALMRIDAFQRLGGYNDTFSHNEDAEFDLRLSRTGGRIWIDPRLAVDYFPRSTPAALFRQYRNYGRGRARTVRLHRVRLKARQILPLLVAPALLAALVAPLAGLASPAGWLLAGPALAWVFAGLVGGALVGARSGSLCGWLSGGAALVMHLGWSLGYWSEWLGIRGRDARSVTTKGPKPGLLA